MEFCTEAFIRWIKVQKQEIGAGARPLLFPARHRPAGAVRPGVALRRRLRGDLAGPVPRVRGALQRPGLQGIRRRHAPNWFINISSTLEKKLQGLSLYSGEMREWPHARSIKAVEHLARWRGATIGYEAAEAFILGRNIED